MRSPAAKMALGAAAWIVIAASAFFILQSERYLSARRSTVRTFDVVARETSAALVGLKAAQQGYVAPGQGVGFWMSRVDALLNSALTRLEELGKVTATSDARKMLSEASDTLVDLRAIDKRARQYLNTDQTLMAADVVFSEGGETALMAGRQVEAARLAEYTSFDVVEASTRQRQVYAAGGATGLAALIITFLLFAPARVDAAIETSSSIMAGSTSLVAPSVVLPPVATAPSRTDQTSNTAAATKPAESAPERPTETPEVLTTPLPVSPELPREIVPVLTAAADLCVELNRARDVEQLERLLSRAAEVLDATGLVVWIGTPGAAILRPVLAHGYSPQTLTRMPPVPRNGNNAAAAAFRTGKLQIVLTRPGVSAGALAAPMLTPNGCIGALTAEIKNGGETSDGVQALAAIVASQLSGVLAESVLQSGDADLDDQVEPRIASA